MNPSRFCHFICVGTFLLLLINLSVVAQEPQVLTLEESIEIAKQSNLTLQTAKQDLKAAEAQVRAARAGLLPRVTASGNYTYFRDIQKSVIQAEGGFGFPMPDREMDSGSPPSADNESDLIEVGIRGASQCARHSQFNAAYFRLGTLLLRLSSRQTQLSGNAA